MEKTYYVYILANINHSVIYTGITSNLRRRIFQHKNKALPGFTTKYRADRLVYVETFSDPSFAIRREKRIKGYSRARKMALVEEKNKGWVELIP